MDFSAFKTQLNIRLGDTDNFTFTDEEKTSNLTEAFQDESVVSPAWDSSLTFDTSTYQYARPATVDVVQDIYIRLSNASDTEPQKIDSALWEVVGANIQFKAPAFSIIPDNYTLYLKGKNKYTISDTITEVNVQEYVLNIAQLHCLNMLGVKKALKFLKNDISVNELVTIKRELERKVGQYKQRLPRSFENG